MAQTCDVPSVAVKTSMREINLILDLTSEAVWRLYLPQNLNLFVGLKLMEVLSHNESISPKFLKFSKNLQKSSGMSPKILKNQILHFPPCQPQVY